MNYPNGSEGDYLGSMAGKCYHSGAGNDSASAYSGPRLALDTCWLLGQVAELAGSWQWMIHCLSTTLNAPSQVETIPKAFGSSRRSRGVWGAVVGCPKSLGTEILILYP